MSISNEIKLFADRNAILIEENSGITFSPKDGQIILKPGESFSIWTQKAKDRHPIASFISTDSWVEWRVVQGKHDIREYTNKMIPPGNAVLVKNVGEEDLILVSWMN